MDQELYFMHHSLSDTWTIFCTLLSSRSSSSSQATPTSSRASTINFIVHQNGCHGHMLGSCIHPQSIKELFCHSYQFLPCSNSLDLSSSSCLCLCAWVLGNSLGDWRLMTSDRPLFSCKGHRRMIPFFFSFSFGIPLSFASWPSVWGYSILPLLLIVQSAHKFTAT